MSFIYLASPYSHPNAMIRAMRYGMARDAIAYLLKRRIWAYSPIVHCHDLACHEDLPRGFAFWRPYNHAMLQAASGLYMLGLVGAETSEGMADEYTQAEKLGLPVTHMKPLGDHDYSFDPPLNHSLGVVK